MTGGQVGSTGLGARPFAWRLLREPTRVRTRWERLVNAVTARSLCPARRPTRGSWPLVATSLAQRWTSRNRCSPCSQSPYGPLRRMGSEALKLGGDRAEPRSYAYFAPCDNQNASWPWMPAGHGARHSQRSLMCAGLRRARLHRGGPASRGDAGSDWSGTVNGATQPTLEKTKGRPTKWDCP